MKVAFSTLGCPYWTWNDIVSTAKDLGYDGIEIRGIGSELYAPNIKEFSDENISNTRERLKKLNLEIPCLTSSCFLFEKENTESNITEGKEYIDLARKLGVPYVRVLGDRNPEPGEKIDFQVVKDNITELARYSDGKGVKILIETNGFFGDPAQVLKLIDAVGSSNLRVLWDIHHPYRFLNIPVDETYKALKGHICHVHVKDSAIEGGKVRYKLLGQGDVPVFEAINLLLEDGYEGYVSLEWVKRWLNDLEEPGIVFSHFINNIRKAIEMRK